MNWFDYTRGYDDGREDYRTGRNINSLLLALFQFTFAILIVLLQLSFYILKGLAGLLWTIVRWLMGRYR